MARINLAVFNCKGGVGKTTISIILTQIALKKHKRVLAFDQDEQCNFSVSMSYIQHEKEFKDLLTVKTALIKEDFDTPADWLIIDCPPHFNERTRFALKNADIILIPVRPDYYSVMNISKIIENAGDYKKLRQFPIVKVGFTENIASKRAESMIPNKNYSLAGDLPLYATITANISSNRKKWWSVGLTDSERSHFEVMYQKLEWIFRKITEHSSSKKESGKYYEYHEDTDNPDIQMFGLNSAGRQS